MGSDLQVKTSPRPQSRLALEVLVPAERCQRSYHKAVRKLCRTVRLPGFRPGRVPQTAVLQQLGARHVWINALEQLLEDTAQELLNDDDLRLLGKLQLEDSFDVLAQRFNPDESLTLNMEADVHPNATLKAYRDLEIEVEEDSVADRLEETLQKYRRSAGAMVPLEKTTAGPEDVAVIQLVLPPADGADGEEGSAEPRAQEMEVDLAEANEITSDLVATVIGMTVGETRTISDDANPNPDERDGDQEHKSGDVSIILRALKARQLPELDDAFAQKVSHFDTMAELRDALRRKVEEEVRENNKESRQDALLGKLCEDMTVELPRSMVEQEMDAVTEDAKDDLRSWGLDPDRQFNGGLLDSLKPVRLAEAQRRLQRNLALEAVAKAEQLAVPETELDQQVESLAKRFKAGRKARKVDIAKLRAFVRTRLLREKALDWLEDHNTFKVRTAAAAEGEEGQGGPAPAVDPAESISE